MKDMRCDLLAERGAIAVLALYGLDQILTAQDDPALWAAILIRHWPAPSSPDMDPTALRFGIAKIPSDEALASPRSGLEEIETWCFEPAGTDRLRVVPCMDRPQPSFMFALAMGASANDPGLLSGRMYLDVSRPSQGEARALVHSGVSAPPNAGTGETRYWQIGDQGAWGETQQTASRWLT
jgi:hypothetical protein